MKTVELKAKTREGTGKSLAKKLRTQGIIPAVVYGTHQEAISVQVDHKELRNVLHSHAGANVLISLKIEGAKKDLTVLIKALQHDPVSDFITHVDFNAISMTEAIHTKVPVHEKGEAQGVKDGGVVDHAHREIEVECLPTQIPDKIEVLISHLKINDSVCTKDLVLPKGVKCLLPPDEVIIRILPPSKEEVAAPAVEGEAKAEPEVLTAKKPAEGEAAAGETSKAAPSKKE